MAPKMGVHGLKKVPDGRPAPPPPKKRQIHSVLDVERLNVRNFTDMTQINIVAVIQCRIPKKGCTCEYLFNVK